MKKKLNPEIKISKSRHEEFQALLSDLIQSGHDVQLWNGQSQIQIWLPEGRCISLVLNINGTWETQ